MNKEKDLKSRNALGNNLLQNEPRGRMLSKNALLVPNHRRSSKNLTSVLSQSLLQGAPVSDPHI